MERTALHDEHVRAGARMVEFGGWEMPVQYTSILEEHLAVRRDAGLFDLSHMGRYAVRGKGALAALERVCTVRVASIAPGGIKYSLLCREDGGVLDDVLVYNGTLVAGGDAEYSIVVNAGNRKRDFDWIAAACRDHGATLVDRSGELSMITVQGAKSVEMLESLADVDLDALHYYFFTTGRIAGEAMVVSRTGYTGDDGFEMYVPTPAVGRVWTKLLAEGRGKGLVLAGLGARDSLRTEAGMPLYGHEISLEVNPFEARLSWAVDLEKDVVGRAALAAVKARGVTRRIAGFVATGKRIPRQGFPVFAGERRVGEVTSGTRTPLTDRNIGMAMLEIGSTAVGTELHADVRGDREPIRIEKLPFYSRHRRPGAAKEEAAARAKKA
jgi:glycine cleavage system T protein (aminomethyltransferase)